MTLCALVTLDLSCLADRVGDLFGPADPVMIDQAMVDAFAKVTGDLQWVHVDVARAHAEVGSTLVHGYFTLSLIPLFVSRLVAITGVGRALNYGVNKVRFPAALPTGASVSGSFRLISAARRGDGVLMICQHSIAALDAKRPGCVAETMTLLEPGDGVFGPFRCI